MGTDIVNERTIEIQANDTGATPMAELRDKRDGTVYWRGELTPGLVIEIPVGVSVKHLNLVMPPTCTARLIDMTALMPTITRSGVAIGAEPGA